MRRRARRLALLALAPVLVACGKVGPPVPPELRVPAPVADVTGTVGPGRVELTWSTPSRRVDDTRLDRLAAATVWRSEDAGAGEPRPAVLARGRVPGYRDVATVRLDSPQRTRPGDRVSVVDREGLSYGRRYSYVVVTEDLQGRRSPPSPRLSLTFIPAPEAPRDLRAEPGEREARLAWTAPTRLVDGQPAGELAYDVLRAAEPDGPFQLVTPAPVSTPSFVDTGLENDRAYSYAVRAVRRAAETTARSEETPRVSVTPADMTPPSPPTALTAIPSVGAVRLSWRASPEPDVSGYIVYRAPEGGAWSRLGTTRAPDTTYTDRDVARGTYRYAVSAHDAGSRVNESARSGEVTVVVP